MINLKWGIFPAVAAFFIALLLRLTAGQASFLDSLLLAVVFAAVFFGVGIGLWFIINKFIPELLTAEEENDNVANIFATDQAGPQINISVGDSTPIAVPQGGAIDEVENISDLMNGKNRKTVKAEDIDQSPATGYTESVMEPANENADVGDFIMNFSSFDLDSEADSYSLPSNSGSSSDLADEQPERRHTGNKPVEFEGDFNPKEIAAGIRTVLEKDKKG